MSSASEFGERAHRFCALVGSEVPVVQAPMAGGWITPELVAAVANAGGLGMIAAARLSTDRLLQAIDETRRLTDRPFGVNFLLAPPEPFDGDRSPVQATFDRIRAEMELRNPPAGADGPTPVALDEQLRLVLERGVGVVSFALGDPSALVGRVHAAGGVVLATATTVEEAIRLDAAGVDVIVAQGAEAGGHRSTFRVRYGEELPLIGTVVLVPAIADAVPRPVLASGGVMDGRGLAAALALGASGVQMGTRFLIAQESGAFPEYRERIVRGRDTDTVVTWQFTGRPARSLRNRFLELTTAADHDPLPWPHQAAAARDIYQAAIDGGHGDYAPLLAGQGVAIARRVQPAAEVVAEVVAEARQALARLAGAANDARG